MKEIIPVMVIGFPAAILIFLFKKIIFIRIGVFDSTRIGHSLSVFLDYCLGCQQIKTNDYYYPVNSNRHANVFWWCKWSSKVKIIPRWIGYPAAKALGFFKKGNDHLLAKHDLLEGSEILLQSVNKYGKSQISFNREEESRGKFLLEKLGILDKPFICVANRDAKYCDTLYPEMDMSHHDFRNSKINDYTEASLSLISKYYVIRVGTHVEECFDLGSPDIIDYSNHSLRSDFNDVFLMSKCYFAIYPESGISLVSEIFQRPILYTNHAFIHFPHWWCMYGLMIFKKFQCSESGDVIPYKKIIMDYPVKELVCTGNWSEAGINLVDNSPEEIRDAALEMDERLNKSWEDLGEDDKLKESYWKIFDPPRPHTKDLQVATTFVRKYPELFV